MFAHLVLLFMTTLHIAACGGDEGTSGGCGDGRLDSGEECDGVEHCTPDCRAETGFSCDSDGAVCDPVCGDGLVVVDECDKDYPGSGCATDCNTCGNGLIEASKEDCDDGNRTDGDGCDATCFSEPGHSCSGAPSVCAASGLEPTRAISDLTESELETWCTWLINFAGEGTAYVECMPLASYNLESVAGCVAKYKSGIVRGEHWWCGHVDYDSGFNACSGTPATPSDARRPLAGCTVGEAETFLFESWAEDEERQESGSPEYQYGPCGLFIAGGEPQCSL